MALNVQNSNLKISAGLPKQFTTKAIPQIAFSGRSNVGKSSLINTLLGRKSLARVSSAPGKTITINFYEVDAKLFLVDLPGYGFAKRPPAEKAAWSALTDGYFTQNKNIDLLKVVIQLIDARVGPTKDDLMMIDWLIQSEMPFVIVATKMDKLNKTEASKVIGNIRSSAELPEDIEIIPFSSETKEGKQTLWNVILSYSDLL